jgi:hypothetical protein
VEEMKVQVNIETKGEIKPWCHICGRVVDKVIEVPIPCPWCATEVLVRMCFDCARALRDAIDKALKETQA